MSPGIPAPGGQGQTEDTSSNIALHQRVLK